jgi:hypothetical protein
MQSAPMAAGLSEGSAFGHAKRHSYFRSFLMHVRTLEDSIQPLPVTPFY